MRLGTRVTLLEHCVKNFNFLHMSCSQLAKRGLNVVLISRSEEKLNKVATEISELMHNNVIVVSVCLSVSILFVCLSTLDPPSL